jgi:hypothetical protein
MPTPVGLAPHVAEYLLNVEKRLEALEEKAGIGPKAEAAQAEATKAAEEAGGSKAEATKADEPKAQAKAESDDDDKSGGRSGPSSHGPGRR